MGKLIPIDTVEVTSIDHVYRFSGYFGCNVKAFPSGTR